MKRREFPKLIHVVREGDDENQYLAAYEDGVVGIEEHGTKVAIYQLVKVGTVSIAKTFQDIPKKRRR